MPTKHNNAKSEQLAVRFPRDVMAALRSAAGATGKTVSAVAVLAVERGLPLVQQMEQDPHS